MLTLTCRRFFGSMLRLRSKEKEEEGEDLFIGVLERSRLRRDVVLGEE